MWDLALFRMQSCNFSANFLDKFCCFRFLEVAECSYLLALEEFRFWTLFSLPKWGWYRFMGSAFIELCYFSNWWFFFFLFSLLCYISKKIFVLKFVSEHCCFLSLLCLRKHLIFEFISMLMGQKSLIIRFFFLGIVFISSLILFSRYIS